MWRRFLGIWVLVVPMVVGGGGCLVLPHGDWKYDSRPGIGKGKDVGFVRPGVTTRRELLLRIGEPDWVVRGPRGDGFAYCWSTSDFDGAVLIPFGSGAVANYSNVTWHELRVEFDDVGRVTRSDVRSEGARLVSWVSH